MNEETRIKLRETCRVMMADLETSTLKGKTPFESPQGFEGLAGF